MHTQPPRTTHTQPSRPPARAVIRTRRIIYSPTLSYVDAWRGDACVRHEWDDGAGPGCDSTETEANHWLALAAFLEAEGGCEAIHCWHGGVGAEPEEMVWVWVYAPPSKGQS